MSRSPIVFAAADGAGSAPGCGGYRLCQQVYDWFGQDWLAENARALIATSARIALVVVLAAVLRLLAHRAVRRLTDSTATGAMPRLRARRPRASAHAGAR